MENEEPQFDAKRINELNERTIKSSLFTPDFLYADFGLFKDIPLGCINTDLIVIRKDREAYERVTAVILNVLKEYQSRMFDTIEPLLKETGYDDAFVKEMLSQQENHDNIFIMSPPTRFIQCIHRHILRNQNNSRPADKYEREIGEDGKPKVRPVDVNLKINTFPLTLSPGILVRWGQEFGEALGVNVSFINKDPATFNETDWSTWMKDIECFYIDDIGRLSSSSMFLEKQGNMEFVSKHFYIRKRFEKSVERKINLADLPMHIQTHSALLGFYCLLEWLQNNDVRLTQEAEHVPMMEEEALIPKPFTTE